VRRIEMHEHGQNASVTVRLRGWLERAFQLPPDEDDVATLKPPPPEIEASLDQPVALEDDVKRNDFPRKGNSLAVDPPRGLHGRTPWP